MSFKLPGTTGDAWGPKDGAPSPAEVLLVLSAVAMHGILSTEHSRIIPPEHVAEHAMKTAKALINQLELELS